MEGRDPDNAEIVERNGEREDRELVWTSGDADEEKRQKKKKSLRGLRREVKTDREHFRLQTHDDAKTPNVNLMSANDGGSFIHRLCGGGSFGRLRGVFDPPPLNQPTLMGRLRFQGCERSIVSLGYTSSGGLRVVGAF
ncbi:unnamed protein product [Soboliphyme baturini]|uniref:Protein kinase domain-containing protein n=1 Tax=Soboliphyme baturini TaxID=241478 RepID=A0A183IQQ9_9BILA|nr:unnamed protein product [Soboliphyme baturini]